MNKLTCRTCHTEKSAEAFYFRTDSGRYREDCKECECKNLKAKYQSKSSDPEKREKMLSARRKGGHKGMPLLRQDIEPTDWVATLNAQERRSDAAPYFKFPTDLNSFLKPSTMQFYATMFVMNRELIERAKRIYRLSQREDFKVKRDAYNNRQDAAEKRSAYYKERFTDPAYSLARKEENANYYVQNREAILVRNNKWEAENKDHVRAYMAEYASNNRKTKPWWNIRGRLATRISGLLRKYNVKKSNTTVELIGCTVAELRDQFTSQFTEGMTWELFLQGKIHIDHRVPCVSFDLTDPAEQKKCFHHSNLQPLWALDNLRKSATVPHV